MDVEETLICNFTKHMETTLLDDKILVLSMCQSNQSNQNVRSIQSRRSLALSMLSKTFIVLLTSSTTAKERK